MTTRVVKTSSSFSVLSISFMGFFAALAWVVFALLRFDIPIPAGRVPIHFANAVCVLAGLILGPWKGGIAGAVGLALGDLTGGYAHAVLPTLIVKFIIGFIAGVVAKRLKLFAETFDKHHLLKVLASAAIALLVFNVFLDPLFRYYIYQMIGIHRDLAKMLGLFNIYISALNGVLNTLIVTLVFPILKRRLIAMGIWHRVKGYRVNECPAR